MTNPELINYRLTNQCLAGDKQKLNSAGELIRYMGALQSQDFAAAKWAIGNRIEEAREINIEQDFNEGKILRTHVLRPTWHFIAPEDIRWMLQFTGPKIRNKFLSQAFLSKHKIDTALLSKSSKIIAQALSNGTALSRSELAACLQQEKIDTEDQRLNVLLLSAELEGLICSGGRKGKQFTYTLLDAKVPVERYMGDEAAVAELAKRYLLSRGPATAADFAWWSGLTLKLAQQGIRENRHLLNSATVGGQEFWYSANSGLASHAPDDVRLLPPFDEYTIAYKNREHILAKEHAAVTGNGIFKSILLIDGQVGGTWKALKKKDSLKLETYPLVKMTQMQLNSLQSAAGNYARFSGKSLTLGS